MAEFTDGTSAQRDFLIGADGIHSRAREIILPEAPPPTYTGMVDCGGFAGLSLLPGPTTHMTYGRRAFFGYVQSPGGEVYWFSNISWPVEPTRSELDAVSKEQWHQRLIEAHAQDPSPIPEILHSTPGAIGKWAVYDLPFLSAWHRGPVCLIGDAAHAISPHIGQGASLAIEDAVVLAKCLRDIRDLQQAFSTYQQLRKGRVEKLVAEARRQGNRKIANPLAGWFRDLMLPVFLKAGARSTRWWYSYDVDWDGKVA